MISIYDQFFRENKGSLIWSSCVGCSEQIRNRIHLKALNVVLSSKTNKTDICRVPNITNRLLERTWLQVVCSFRAICKKAHTKQLKLKKDFCLIFSMWNEIDECLVDKTWRQIYTIPPFWVDFMEVTVIAVRYVCGKVFRPQSSYIK
jgi:hypothetical protein